MESVVEDAHFVKKKLKSVDFYGSYRHLKIKLAKKHGCPQDASKNL